MSVEHSLKSLPGRHVNNDLLGAGINLSLRHINVPPTKLRIYFELKVCSGKFSEKKVLGQNGDFLTKSEACNVDYPIQTNSQRQGNIYYLLINTIGKKFGRYCPSSIPSVQFGTFKSMLRNFQVHIKQTFRFVRRDLELTAVGKDHDYCRTSTKALKFRVRLTVKKCPRYCTRR